MNELIKGGIYSISGLDNMYCIFVEKVEFSDMLNTYYRFFEIKTKSNNIKDILETLNPIVLNESNFSLKYRMISLTKDEFCEQNNGFMGIVEPWVLDKLSNL